MTAMGWFVTADSGEFLAEAGEFRPAPDPEGAARLATERDRDLLAEWFDAFAREVGDPPGHDNRAVVNERLGYRPVENRVVFSFEPARHALRFTRERTRGLRGTGRW